MTHGNEVRTQKLAPRATTVKRILVTGFEPFGASNVNVSQDAVLALEESMLYEDPWSSQREIPDAKIHTLLEREILTVDQKGSLRTAQRIAKGEQWDGILHIGVCGTCTTPHLEQRAQDLLHMEIADNSGRRMRSMPLSGEGDFTSTAPINLWLQNWDTDAKASFDAGTYICNETLYRSLEALGDTSMPCFFLHLPKAETYPFEKSMEVVHEVLARMAHKPVMSVAGAVFIDDGRFLVARRAEHEAHSGTWEFPGGKLEPQETPHAAVEREIEEEFGWKVQAKKSIGTWWHHFPSVTIALDAMLCTFDGDFPSFEVQERWTSHDRVEWHTVPSSSILDFTGSDQHIAAALLDGGHLG